MKISDNLEVAGDIMDKIAEHDDNIIAILNLICTDDNLIVTNRLVLDDFDMVLNVIYTLLKINPELLLPIMGAIIGAKDDLNEMKGISVDSLGETMLKINIITNKEN